jgi:hypothetical protein
MYVFEVESGWNVSAGHSKEDKCAGNEGLSRSVRWVSSEEAVRVRSLPFPMGILSRFYFDLWYACFISSL